MPAHFLSTPENMHPWIIRRNEPVSTKIYFAVQYRTFAMLSAKSLYHCCRLYLRKVARHSRSDPHDQVATCKPSEVALEPEPATRPHVQRNTARSDTLCSVQLSYLEKMSAKPPQGVSPKGRKLLTESPSRSGPDMYKEASDGAPLKLARSSQKGRRGVMQSSPKSANDQDFPLPQMLPQKSSNGSPIREPLAFSATFGNLTISSPPGRRKTIAMTAEVKDRICAMKNAAREGVYESEMRRRSQMGVFVRFRVCLCLCFSELQCERGTS